MSSVGRPHGIAVTPTRGLEVPPSHFGLAGNPYWSIGRSFGCIHSRRSGDARGCGGGSIGLIRLGARSGRPRSQPLVHGQRDRLERPGFGSRWPGGIWGSLAERSRRQGNPGGGSVRFDSAQRTADGIPMNRRLPIHLTHLRGCLVASSRGVGYVFGSGLQGGGASPGLAVAYQSLKRSVAGSNSGGAQAAKSLSSTTV